MSNRKPNKPNTPSLFGETETDRPAKKPRKPNELGPWWEAVAKLIGFQTARAGGGRVWAVAGKIKAAGIAPEQLDALPKLIRQYAAWRKVIDLGAVQSCYIWILEPPKVVTPGRSAATDAAGVIKANGGDLPF